MITSPIPLRHARKRVTHRVEGESRTHTVFAQDCDLPAMVKRLAASNRLGEALRQPPLQYGDFSNVTDYMSALLAVKDANAAFMSLPANVRREFDNNPAALLAAVHDPDQAERLRELGVLNPLPSPPPPEAADDGSPEPSPAEPVEA